MPRQSINDPGEPFMARVGWERDGSVQLGVETTDGRSLVSFLYGDPEPRHRLAVAVVGLVKEYQDGEFGSPAELGRRILDAVEVSPWENDGSPTPSVPDSYVGVWASLSRHAINRLIRALRKARDDAYGADA